MENIVPIDLELTPELKLALGRSPAIDIKKTFLYSLSQFRQIKEDGSFLVPKALWPVFDLRPLSGIEQQKITSDHTRNVQNPVTGKLEVTIDEGAFKLDCLKAGILKWNFLYDQDWKRFAIWDPSFRVNNEITNEALGFMSPATQEEILGAILYTQSLTDLELLNLKS